MNYFEKNISTTINNDLITSSTPALIVPFLFFLVFLKLILSGVSETGVAARSVDVIFVAVLFVYLIRYSGYYFHTIPNLQIAIIFLSSTFFLTELFTNKNLIDTIFNFLKVVTPYIAFMVFYKLLRENKPVFVRLTIFVVLGCYLLTIVGFFALSNEMNRGVAYAPAFFGGLHTSSYVITLSGICAYILWKLNAISGRLAFICLLASLILIVVAWNVRTSQMLFLIFFAVQYWKSIRKFVIPLAFITLICLLTALLILMLTNGTQGLSFNTITEFSSGRTTMWLYKLQLLSNRSLIEFIFGQGSGSDLVLSDVWWWAAKDSHNDFLHVTTELGVVGLVGLLSTLWIQRCTLSRNQLLATSLFSAYISASVLSNGLVYRPIPSFIFAIAAALLTLPKDEKQVS